MPHNPQLTKQQDDALVAVRSNLLLKQPYLASHLYSKTRMEFDPATPTAATSGTKIKVGPWFTDLPMPQRVFVLAHEVLHDIFGHIARRDLYIRRGFGPDMEPFDPDRWDRACDYYVNNVLVQSNIGQMPPEALYDPDYSNITTVDQVYEKVPGKGKNNPDQPDPPQNFDQHLPGDQPMPTQGDGDEEGDGDQPSPGKPMPSEEDIKEQVKQNMASAMAAAKAAGKAPGGLLGEIIDAEINPKITWREELAGFVQRCAGREETSWRRCNRRRLANPPFIPYPGRDGHQISSLVVAIDASGSISEREYKLFMEEIKGIHEQLNPASCYVLWWDTDVAPIEITSADDLEALQPNGGGGTLYGCVPEWLEENGIEPEAVICLSDGFVSWPDADAIRWPHITVETSHYGEPCPVGKTLYFD